MSYSSYLKGLGICTIITLGCQNNTTSPPHKVDTITNPQNIPDTIYNAASNQKETKGNQTESIPSKLENKKTDQPKKVGPKKKAKKKYPIISFDSTSIHIPDMIEGDVVDLKFKFWNDGNAPLSIKEVDVTCGCTTPSIPFLDINPGDTSSIDIQYKSVGKSGLQEPEIIVKTNGKPKFTTLAFFPFINKKNMVAE